LTVSLCGCGGGGNSNPGGNTGTLAFKVTTLSTPVIPTASAGNGEVCSVNGATATFQVAPSFASENLPIYSGGNTSQNVAYGIGSTGSIAGYAYQAGQSQDVPIYWSTSSSQAVALPLPNGLPSMIASISGLTLYGYTTGSNTGGSFGIYQWPTPTSQPVLVSSSFPSGCTINSVLPGKRSFVAVIVTNQTESYLVPSSGSEPTAMIDGVGSTNVIATSVGPDGTVYGLSSTETPVYWPSGSTSSPSLLPTYTDPSFSGSLRATEVFVNAKNKIAATYIGSDGNLRSCLWTTRTSQPYDLGKQPFGIAASAPGPSIAVMALFDDGSLVARTGSGANTYYYMTRK